MILRQTHTTHPGHRAARSYGRHAWGGHLVPAGALHARPQGLRGARDRHRTLWRRFADDHDLVGAKLMLLGALLVLTAALERAV